MIVVKLMGGLGNQMFQAARGLAMAKRSGRKLAFDLTFLQNRDKDLKITFRDYELSIFQKEFKILDPRLIRLLNKANRLLSRLTNLEFFKSWKEGDGQEWEDLSRYWVIGLEGYWQSEKYFEDVVDIIRTAFVFRQSATGLNAELLRRIQTSSSVSIHIRRGDYVSDPNAQKVHGTCDLQYYRRAMTAINESVENPSYFVFSDDIPWAREHLDVMGKKVTFCSQNNDKNNWEDLRLMAACKHNIVANSSFSWWGGWLNGNEEKLVIGPKKWFNDEEMNKQFAGILPESWQRV